MNEFNVSSEYKKYRQNKKKKAAKIHKIKVVAAVIAVILVAISLVAFLILKGTFNRKDDNTTPQYSVSAPTDIPTSISEVHIPTIFIHPGHGALLENGTRDEGIGNGSAYFEESRGKTESDLTLEIALKLQNALTSLGYNAILSRNNAVEHTLSDTQICNIIKSSSADLVISIHGGSGMPNDRGAAIYYSDLNKFPNSSRKLAESIAYAIDSKEGQIHTEKTNLSLSDLDLLKDAGIPAIQIDVLNLSNELDSKLGVSQSWQEKFAVAVSMGIEAEFPIE